MLLNFWDESDSTISPAGVRIELQWTAFGGLQSPIESPAFAAHQLIVLEVIATLSAADAVIGEPLGGHGLGPHGLLGEGRKRTDTDGHGQTRARAGLVWECDSVFLQAALATGRDRYRLVVTGRTEC